MGWCHNQGDGISAAIGTIVTTVMDNEWLLVIALIVLAVTPATVVMSFSKRRMKRRGENPAEAEFNYLNHRAQRRQ